MSFRDKTRTALRDLIESRGENGAVEVIKNGLESNKFNPDDFSLREIWESCQLAAGLDTDVQEAVVSTSFPKITGALINSRLIAGYNEIASIADQLIQTVQSNVQTETIAGFTEAEGPEEVGENDDYHDSTFTEKWVSARNQKYGRMISITEEAIYFDKTGQILERSRRMGMKARQYKERLVLHAVMDVNSNVYRPSGVATAFFSAAHNNLITSNSFGESGLEAVRKNAQMMKDDASVQPFSDYDFIMIDINNMLVLVPVDLELEAWQMANSTLTPESNENAANFFRQRFRPMTSPFVTANSSTTWYCGDPRMDFWWLEVWPLQVLSQAAGHDDSFKKDVKARHKIRFYGAPTAIDYRHWFKCTA